MRQLAPRRAKEEFVHLIPSAVWSWTDERNNLIPCKACKGLFAVIRLNLVKVACLRDWNRYPLQKGSAFRRECFRQDNFKTPHSRGVSCIENVCHVAVVSLPTQDIGAFR